MNSSSLNVPVGTFSLLGRVVLGRVLLPLVLFSGIVLPAMAQESLQGPSLTLSHGESSKETTLRLGAGAILRPDFEGSSDSAVYPLPVLELRNWSGFDFTGRELSYRLYRWENAKEEPFKKIAFRLDPVVGPSVSREEDTRFLFISGGDNKYLRGLEDVDTGLDIGITAQLRTGPLNTRLAIKKEVAGGHDGLTALLGLGTRIPLGESTLLGLELTTTWADDNYMDAFFSIDSEAARKSIYRRYDASSGFKDAGFTLSMFHDLNDRVSLFGIGQYNRLLGDSADSPLVKGPGGSRDQFTVFGGVTWKWTFGK